jgi:hypothetical protein
LTDREHPAKACAFSQKIPPSSNIFVAGFVDTSHQSLAHAAITGTSVTDHRFSLLRFDSSAQWNIRNVPDRLLREGTLAGKNA